MRKHQRLNTYNEERASRKAARKAEGAPSTSRKPMSAKNQAMHEALLAYTAARKEAIANGTTLPNMRDYMPKEVA